IPVSPMDSDSSAGDVGRFSVGSGGGSQSVVDDRAQVLHSFEVPGEGSGAKSVSGSAMPSDLTGATPASTSTSALQGDLCALIDQVATASRTTLQHSTEQQRGVEGWQKGQHEFLEHLLGDLSGENTTDHSELPEAVDGVLSEIE